MDTSAWPNAQISVRTSRNGVDERLTVALDTDIAVLWINRDDQSRRRGSGGELPTAPFNPDPSVTGKLRLPHGLWVIKPNNPELPPRNLATDKVIL